MTSETLPASSAPRKKTVPFSVKLTASVYASQVCPSSEYSLTTESALNVAVTLTSEFVMEVISAEAVGFSGATVSMLETWKPVTSETFPASSVPRK